jgi:hypothetical protein
MRPSSASAGAAASSSTLLAPAKQPRADADQQFDEKRFLVGEVAVDRGAADPGCRPDVLESHGEEPAFGHQSLGGGDEL